MNIESMEKLFNLCPSIQKINVNRLLKDKIKEIKQESLSKVFDYHSDDCNLEFLKNL